MLHCTDPKTEETGGRGRTCFTISEKSFEQVPLQ